MPRQAAPTDFEVVVEDVGTFRFAKRSMRDHIDIEVEFARIIDGTEPTEYLHVLAKWLSTFKVLTVLAPSGWDIDNMNPLDAKTYKTLSAVYDALKDKEGDFRGGPSKEEQASGAPVGQNPGVLVPEKIQPNA